MREEGGGKITEGMKFPKLKRRICEIVDNKKNVQTSHCGEIANDIQVTMNFTTNADLTKAENSSIFKMGSVSYDNSFSCMAFICFKYVSMWI